MSKGIKGVVIVIATLVVIAITWTFVLGPGGIAQSVGASFFGRVDTLFNNVGITTDIAGMYDDAFEDQNTKDIVY